MTACNGACVDLTSSQLNCGSCGSACASGKLCASSACYTPPPSTWQTLGADGQHSGNNPNETGRPPLAPLWSHTMGSGELWPVVFDNGTLFAMRGGTLYALNPADGSMKWTRALGNGTFSQNVGMPTTSGGRVYAAESGNSGNTFLYVVDEATGAVSQTFPFNSQWETYWAPLVVGDKVYFNGGGYGGMYGYNATTASQLFFVSLDQYDSWSPAVFNNVLYSFIDGNFRAHSITTGAVSWNITVPYAWSGYSMETAVVFGSKYGYFISPPTLYAVDPAAKSTVWSDGVSYSLMPAYAGNVVFAIGNKNLRALNATTGALLWTFAGDGALAYPPAIANGYVYVASDANTYAVDLHTHQQVWTTAKGGWMSIAGGSLFIASSSGALSAYSLSQ
jgi:outer membrane protein assembly factor BamB